MTTPEDPAVLIANEVYRLARNYQARTANRSERDLSLLISRRCWYDLIKSPSMGGVVDPLGYTFMGLNVMLSENVADDEVRFVLKPDHKLLEDLPRLP